MYECPLNILHVPGDFSWLARAWVSVGCGHPGMCAVPKILVGSVWAEGAWNKGVPMCAMLGPPWWDCQILCECVGSRLWAALVDVQS